MKKSYFKKNILFILFITSCINLSAAWIETEITTLTSTDVFLIIDITSSCALINSNGTSSSPTATSVTLNEAKNNVIGNVTDNMKWNIGETDDNYYIFYPNGQTNKWLYCNANNIGLRVGTGAAKAFALDQNWLTVNDTKDQKRWIGVYYSSNTPQDWRSYNTNPVTTTSSNIKNTVTKFFKYVEDGGETNFIPTIITPRKATAFVQNGVLFIQAAAGDIIEIYNALGQKLKSMSAQGDLTSIRDLRHGQILIIKINGRALKVSI